MPSGSPEPVRPKEIAGSCRSPNQESRIGPAVRRPPMSAPLPRDARELLMHLRSRLRFFRLISRQGHETITMDRCLRDARASVGLRRRGAFVDSLGIEFCRRDGILLERVVFGRCARVSRHGIQLLLGRCWRACGTFETATGGVAATPDASCWWYAASSRSSVADLVLRSASCLQCALMPVARLQLGLPTKLCAIEVCRLASTTYRS